MARRLQDIGATVFMCQPKASANGGIRIQTVIQRHVSKSHYMGGGGLNSRALEHIEEVALCNNCVHGFREECLWIQRLLG